MIIDTLTFQLAEREKHNENLECEIVGLVSSATEFGICWDKILARP